MNSHTAAINLQSSAGHQRGFSSSVVPSATTNSSEWLKGYQNPVPIAPARHQKRPAPQPGAVQQQQQQQIQQPQYQTALQAHSNHGTVAGPPLPPHTINVSLSLLFNYFSSLMVYLLLLQNCICMKIWIWCFFAKFDSDEKMFRLISILLFLSLSLSLNTKYLITLSLYTPSVIY